MTIYAPPKLCIQIDATTTLFRFSVHSFRHSEWPHLRCAVFIHCSHRSRYSAVVSYFINTIRVVHTANCRYKTHFDLKAFHQRVDEFSDFLDLSPFDRLSIRMEA